MAYQSKKHRKFVATSVTAALVATAVAPAAGFAAEFKDEVPAWAKDAVDYLIEKGAINGYEDGTFKPNAPIKRGEAAKILALALELEIDDNAKTEFVDAKDHWASKYIAAIQKHNENIINGYEGKFRPNDTITRQEMAKMIVTAYDLKLNEDADVSFTDNNGWGAEYVNILASLGIVEGVGNGKFDPNGAVTRAQTPVFVFRTEVPSERVEVPKKPVTTPEVVSVSALNAKEIEIKFNVELDVDSAEDLANYRVYKHDALTTNVVDDAGAKAVLLADGKTVRLTLENGVAFANDTTTNYVEVTTGVKSKTGVALAEKFVESKLAVRDSKLPELVEIKQIALNKIQLVFDEPVQDQDGGAFEGNEVKIDNGSIPVTSITANGRVLTVTAGGNIPDGEHTVTLVSKSVKDFVNLENLEQSMKFNAVTDTTVPTVTVKSANADKVTLKFSKQVTIPNSGNLAFRALYNNASSNQVLANSGNVTLPGGGSAAGQMTDEIIVDFPYDLPNGNVDIYIEYIDDKDTTNVIKDGYNVVFPEQKIVAQVVADTEKPTVTKVEAINATTVDVTFSEEVNQTEAEKESNYVIKDAEGNVITIVDANLQSGNKKVRLSTANLDGGVYSIEIKNVTDRAVPTPNKMDTYSATFTAKDSVNPTVNKVEYVDGNGVTTKDKIVVTYSEAMTTSGAGSVADKVNYTYSVDNGNTWHALTANDKVEVSANGKVVTITLNSNVTFNGNSAHNILKFGPVTDLSGKKLVSDTTVGHQAAIVPAAVGVVSAEFIGTKQLKVTFDKALSTVVASEFSLIEDDANSAVITNTLSVAAHTITDGKSTVTFDLSNAVAYDAKVGGKNIALKHTGTSTVTADGIPVQELVYNSTFVDANNSDNKIADKINPKLASSNPIQTVDSNGNGYVDHVLITFTEAIAAGTVSVDKITVAGYDVLDTWVGTAPTGLTKGTVQDANTLYVRVKEKTVSDLTATPTVTIADGLKDVSGNAFSFSATDTTPLSVAVSGVSFSIATTQGVATVPETPAVVGGLTFQLGTDLDGYKIKLGTVADGTAASATVDTTNKVITLNGDFSDDDGSGNFITPAQAKTAIEDATGKTLTDVTGTAEQTATGTESAEYVAPVVGVTERVDITITGTATSAGQLVVKAGSKVYYVSVAKDATQNQIATAIKDAINASAPTGYTVSVLNNVVTLTSSTANTDVSDLIVTVQ